MQPEPVAMHSAPLPPWREWQSVLNEAFPPKVAHPRAAKPIPVRVRIVWRIDGECWLEGLAARWTRTAVQVELNDRRLGPLATWVAATDVRRGLLSDDRIVDALRH